MLIVHPKLQKSAYISAYSANGSIVPSGSNVPLTTVINPSENITLDKSKNQLIPTVSGTYSIIISIRANACVAAVVLMHDGMMYSGTTINIGGTNLNQSLTTVIDVEAYKPISLNVMTGPLILPDGTNASITMHLIKSN